MKLVKFLPALAVVAAGCATEIKAPANEFPVFGPYMTPEGNMVKNPLSWGKTVAEPFIVWDAANAEYVIVMNCDTGSRWEKDRTKVWVYHHHLLSEILQSSSCWKWAYDADGKDGVWGPVKSAAIVKDADGKWRMYATALAKKDDESTRREAVFEAQDNRPWSAYSFKKWNEKRTVDPARTCGFDCRGLVRPGNGVKTISSVTAFRSPDGKETWLAYATEDPEVPAKERHPIVCVQKAMLGPDGKPVPAEAEPFGKWRLCPSGEPPVNVTR